MQSWFLVSYLECCAWLLDPPSREGSTQIRLPWDASLEIKSSKRIKIKDFLHAMPVKLYSKASKYIFMFIFQSNDNAYLN